MELSLNILLDDLKDHGPLCYINDKSRTFKGVRLMSRDPEDWQEDRLIITKLSMALSMPRLNPDCCIAAVIDTDLPKEASRLQNMVLFDTKTDPVAFFIIVQKIFERYLEWTMAMDLCLIKNASIQDILTLSEDIIGNYITISDSSFSLVAYTHNLKCSDPITNNLVEKGYHDQEAIGLFSRNNLMDFWRDTVDIYIKPKTNITGYPILSKVIHYNNTYYSHVVMLCTNRLPSEGLKDLFQILLDKLMVCFERQWVENNQMPHIYDSLLLEMLESDELSAESINARAKNAGIPVKGNFRLIKVSTEDSSGIMLQRLCQELSANISQSRVTLSKDILIALIPLKPAGTSQQLMDKVEGIMTKYSSHCGVSDPFYSLSGIRIAGEQAEIALKCCKENRPAMFNIGPERKQTRVMSFGYCYPVYILSSNRKNESILSQTRASKALEILVEHDRKHSTNNLELLFVYLTNERRASDTAQIMHMHRNNVIYRIGKISEMINMDLNECGIRFRLLMAYATYKEN